MSDTSETTNADARPEARLVDIVVEEVSLVDQAANKRQFLIIKRARNTMANSAVSKGAAGSSQPEAGGASASSASRVSDATLDALQRIAKAVGDVADEIDEPSDIARLVAIAEQLNALVESVLEDADDEDEEAESSEDANKGVGADANGDATTSTGGTDKGAPTRLEEAFAKIETTLAALQAKASARSEPRPETSNVAPTPSGATSEGDPLAKVLTAIAGLSADIKAQGQRLGRLEKGVGLPSSQATSERAPRTRDGEVSWPLDMNAPVARGSVDKTVSFHDD